MTFGVCDCSRLAVTDWRLRRWRLWFLAHMTATLPKFWSVEYFNEPPLFERTPYLKIYLRNNNLCRNVTCFSMQLCLFFRMYDKELGNRRGSRRVARLKSYLNIFFPVKGRCLDPANLWRRRAGGTLWAAFTNHWLALFVTSWIRFAGGGARTPLMEPGETCKGRWGLEAGPSQNFQKVTRMFKFETSWIYPRLTVHTTTK